MQQSKFPASPTPKTNPAETDKLIKGNKNSRIYHWPGCPNYDDISPRNLVWFKNEAEAEAAGFRAAKNCP
jgi:methylphosphotriester-DNA--protein-cysteine methyltransferase